MNRFLLYLILAGLLCKAWAADNLDSKSTYPLSETDWNQLAIDAQLPDTCQLIHLRVVFRHGTRSLYASMADTCKRAIDKLKTAGAKPVGLTAQELSALESWSNTLPTDGSLLSHGRAEHMFHARNYFKLVKSSRPISQYARDFLFESSSMPRAIASGDAFRAQWANLTYVDVADLANMTINDTRNAFYYNCTAFQKRVAKNDAANVEFHRAGSTKQAQAILAKMSRKFGLSNHNLLTWDEVAMLYQMTGTEIAEYGSSVLMTLFDQDDLAYLEYAYDLEEYWTTSYSVDDVTRQMSCVMTNNIFETAETTFRNAAKTSAVKNPGMFTFCHSEVLQSLYGAFNLFYDPREGFQANASQFFYKHRNYDTSVIGRFASNMAFLFYTCPGEHVPSDKLVMMMVNGEPQPFKDACPYDLPCPLEKVKKTYPLITGFPQQCDFRNICWPTSVFPTMRPLSAGGKVVDYISTTSAGTMLHSSIFAFLLLGILQ